MVKRLRDARTTQATRAPEREVADVPTHCVEPLLRRVRPVRGRVQQAGLGFDGWMERESARWVFGQDAFCCVRQGREICKTEVGYCDCLFGKESTLIRIQPSLHVSRSLPSTMYISLDSRPGGKYVVKSLTLMWRPDSI